MKKQKFLKLMLVLVLTLTIWPIFLSLEPTNNKSKIGGFVSISLSGGNVVPFVIAASFSKITDSNNKLILNDGEGENASTRDQVYSLIQKVPGIHFRDICRRLNKEIGVIQYHVYILQKFGEITNFKDGRYTRYFVRSYDFDELGKSIVSAWLRPIERKILIKLYHSSRNEIITKDLLNECNVTIQAISWHLNRLRKYNLIEDSTSSRVSLPGTVQNKIQELVSRGVLTLARA
ncbi:MAG: winged helix-turn-helix transcriptional regulator [Promethearchaeota archaeon]